MNVALLKMFGQERYITDADGKAEFVVLPIEIYKNIVDFIEDYGLGAAIREAEGDKRYNLEEALSYLDDEIGNVRKIKGYSDYYRKITESGSKMREIKLF